MSVKRGYYIQQAKEFVSEQLPDVDLVEEKDGQGEPLRFFQYTDSQIHA